MALRGWREGVEDAGEHLHEHERERRCARGAEEDAAERDVDGLAPDEAAELARICP